MIGREVRRRGPRNVRQLQQFVVEELNRIARRTCLRYVASMRSRCQAVIRANGSHTRYYLSQWNLVVIMMNKFKNLILMQLNEMEVV